MNSLRPCPFCGSKIIAIMQHPRFYFRARCIGCGATTASYTNKDRAISAWNMRSNEKEKTDDELKDMITLFPAYKKVDNVNDVVIVSVSLLPESFTRK